MTNKSDKKSKFAFFYRQSVFAAVDLNFLLDILLVSIELIAVCLIESEVTRVLQSNYYKAVTIDGEGSTRFLELFCG